VFRTAMRELGWVMQVFCDWRLMEELAPTFRDIAREMPVIVDHVSLGPCYCFDVTLRLLLPGNQAWKHTGK
jgi:hypothetical protein